MFSKSLGHDDLEELFQKYADVPSVNEFEFLMKPEYREGQQNGLLIRKFRRNYDEDATVDIAKITASILSEKQVNKDGDRNWLVTLTCPPEVIPKIEPLYLPDRSNPACEYLAGRAAIQEMRPHMKHDMIPAYFALLKDVIVDGLGLPSSAAYEVAKLTEFSDRTRLSRNIVYVEDIGDGDEYAKGLIEQGKEPTINEVHVSGLVYMPPSLSKRGLQFRIRVKRKGDEAALPKDYRTKEGYDYVNVLVHDMKRAEELYMKVKQGHPVFVNGTAEPSKFWTTVKPKNLGKVAEFLNVPYDSIYIDRIRSFFDKSRVDRPMLIIPVVNIWADEVVTGKSAVCERAAEFLEDEPNAANA